MDTPYTPEPNGAAALDEGTSARLVDNIGEKASHIKASVTGLGRQAVDGVDAKRRPVAATLEHTAAALHSQTDRAAGVAHSAADRLRASADYVRANDLKAMATDVGDLVRRHPGQSLLAAGVAGFLVARMVRSRS